MKTFAVAATAAMISAFTAMPSVFADEIYTFSDSGTTFYAQSEPVMLQHRTITTTTQPRVIERTLTQPVVVQREMPVVLEDTQPVVIRRRSMLVPTIIAPSRPATIRVETPLFDLDDF